MALAFNLEEMLGWGRDLYSFGFKRPGTPAGRRAEDYLFGLMTGFGLPRVSLEDIPFWGWFPEETHLALVGGHGSLSMTPQPVVYTGFTSAAGITGEVVDLGAGTEEDFHRADLAGRIALVTYEHGRLPYDAMKELGFYLHDPDGALAGGGQVMSWFTEEEARVYDAAVSAGAAGCIGVFPLDVTPYLCYEGGNAFLGRTGSIPAVGLRRSEGESMKRLMAAGPVAATLIQTGRRERAVTRNVVGIIPGKSDRVVQVTCHHDTMWLGASEDISGVMVVLALAKAMTKTCADRRPELTLAFVLEGAECLYVLGSRGHIGRHRHDLIHNLVVDLHIEHVAREFIEDESGVLVPTGRVQPRALFVSDAGPLPGIVKQAVVDHDLRRTIMLHPDTPVGCPTDATAYNRSGLPVASFISPPLYWNALEDTWDKIAVDELLPTARAYADIIDRLMEVDPDTIRRPGPPKTAYAWYREESASGLPEWFPFQD